MLFLKGLIFQVPNWIGSTESGGKHNSENIYFLISFILRIPMTLDTVLLLKQKFTFHINI